MNLKQLLKNKYSYKYYFNEEHYDNVIDFIRSKNPKKEE